LTGENGQGEEAGRLLAGRYRVVDQLGRGGMGIVWRAVDEVLGREVAVKELRTFTDAAGPELADLRVRMGREARAAARIRHPGVVAVHDVAQQDGRPVIVMELIDGPSLDDVLAERGTIDPREAAAIGARVMEALGAAHRAGVLHRDVKPGNVLLDHDGRVVLTDFGIAAIDDPGDGSSTNLTRSGELVGSLDYLAPERAQGQPPGPASDVWALGATLYAAVEGAAPFRRTSTWSTLTAIVTEQLPEPRLAGPLFPVLQELLNKDPALRPDAGTAAALLAAVAGSSGSTTSTMTLGRPPRTAAGTFGPPSGPPAGPPARVPTEASALPRRPEGFGPPPALTGAASRGGGQRSKALAAAGVAAVLLVGGGVTYALTGGDRTTGTGQAAGGGARSASPAPVAPGGAASPKGGRSPGDQPSEQGDSKGAKTPAEPSKPGKDKGDEGTQGSVSGGGGTEDRPGGPGGGAPGGGAPGGGSDSAGPPGGSGASGGSAGSGSEPDPSPVCYAAGPGKYNCPVWRPAKSYDTSGAEVGVLNSGTQYFYCQQNLGRRETYGKWTNVWWAKTDDDSGNAGVFVSDVYIQGGSNDERVPGLPVC
jgi:hypothetical protein